MRRRNTSEIAAGSSVDRKAVRKYTAAAQAAGIVPGGPAVGKAEWNAKVRRWFPELADTWVRQVIWPAIDPHHRVRPRAAQGGGYGHLV